VDSERAVSQALRAQARRGDPRGGDQWGGDQWGGDQWGGRLPAARPAPFPVAWVLLIALLIGALFGGGLALVSIFSPGLLPSVGLG
jgi:hypothetical protein